jgi:flagellar hook-associated protein 2
MAISAIGVGSGLPLDQLLSDLRNSENTALSAITSRQVKLQDQVSAYGKIKSVVEALQTAGQALDKPETFGAMKTSVSGDGFTASADTTAVAGSYSVSVKTLASNQTLVTSGLASRTDANGTDGVITLTFGDGSTKTLDLTGKDTSIDGIIAAVNGDSSLGLNATVINDGSSSPYRLMLTSTATGTDAALTSISVTGNSDGASGTPLADLLSFGSAGSTVSEQAATNAEVTVNGVTVTSQKNTIEGVIDGVTLNLTSANPAATATLGISRDDSALTNAVDAFVKAYNTFNSTMQSLTSYDTEKQTGSVLTGDSMARRVQSQVRNLLSTYSSTGEIRTLSQLGIEPDLETGVLSFDKTKFSDALSTNLSDVKNLLTGDNGLTKAIASTTGVVLDKDGLIDTATAGTNSILKTLEDQYQSTSDRIDARMENYKKQFTALDSMITQMNSLSTYLTQQFSALSNLSSGSSKK